MACKTARNACMTSAADDALRRCSCVESFWMCVDACGGTNNGFQEDCYADSLQFGGCSCGGYTRTFPPATTTQPWTTSRFMWTLPSDWFVVLVVAIAFADAISKFIARRPPAHSQYGLSVCSSWYSQCASDAGNDFARLCQCFNTYLSCYATCGVDSSSTKMLCKDAFSAAGQQCSCDSGPVVATTATTRPAIDANPYANPNPQRIWLVTLRCWRGRMRCARASG